LVAEPFDLELWRSTLANRRVEVAQHPGTLARDEWTALARMHAVYESNRLDLIQLLGQPEENVDLAYDLVQNVRAISPMAAGFAAETDRRLFNFVSAAKSLVDHSRNLSRRQYDSGFQAAYSSRTTQLRASPPCAFVSDLRHYLLQHALPPLSVRLKISRGPDSRSFATTLSTESLLRSDRWTRLAEAYLTMQGDSVDLRQVALDYHGAVSDTNDWLLAQLPILHRDALAGARALREKYNRCLRDPTG
jgi:hypothetical protein